jgi:integrase
MVDQDTRSLVELVASSKRGKSPITIRQHLYHFFNTVGKGIYDLTKEDILRYTRKKIQKKISLNLTLIYLEKLLNLAGREDLADYAKELRRSIRAPSESEVRRDFLEDDELKAFVNLLWKKAKMNSYKAKMQAALFLTILNTGSRVSEVLNLKPTDIVDTPTQMGITVVTKGGKIDFKPIRDKNVIQLLKSIKASRDGRLFPITVRTAENWFKGLLKEAGLPEKRVMRLRVHDLRRTAALLVYQETKDITKVKEWLGHSKVETTMTYLGEGIKRVQALRRLEAAEILSKKLNEAGE